MYALYWNNTLLRRNTLEYCLSHLTTMNNGFIRGVFRIYNPKGICIVEEAV